MSGRRGIGREIARQQILEWAEQGALPPERVGPALALTGATPGPDDWRRFVSALLLWLGVLLFAAGVIFFFAYNWEDLSRFSKFAIVELLLVSSVVAAWIAGPDKAAGKAALLLSSLVTGALLALIGQTYQTGADPYELFAWWALLILPWTAIARTSAQWLLLVLLLNLTVGSYFQAARGIFGILFQTAWMVWAPFILNTAALAIWELAARRVSWMQDRWAVRIIAAASGTAVTILGVWAIFEAREVGRAAIPVYLAWLAAAYFVYRRVVRDLFVLAGGVLSIIVFVASFLGNEMLRGAEAAGFLFIGLVVIGLSAAGAWWLKRVAEERE